MASTYILYSSVIDKFYVGCTDDLENRVERHNRGHEKFSKRGIPWKLVYFEEYSTKAEAMQREYYIKKQKSRKFIEELIQKRE